MTFVTPSMCRACQRFAPITGTCEAFPAGIPDGIVIYGDDHRVRFPGDNGIRFLPGNEQEQVQAFRDWQDTFGR